MPALDVRLRALERRAPPPRSTSALLGPAWERFIRKLSDAELERLEQALERFGAGAIDLDLAAAIVDAPQGRGRL